MNITGGQWADSVKLFVFPKVETPKKSSADQNFYHKVTQPKFAYKKHRSNASFVSKTGAHGRDDVDNIQNVDNHDDVDNSERRPGS